MIPPVKLTSRTRVLVANSARRLGYQIRRLHKARRIWIDVGAHEGQNTFERAQHDSSILVFAFEPDWNLARRKMGKLENFVVLPMAVADFDGFANFHLNVADETSSLLPFSAEALQSREWKDVAGLAVRSVTTVPTIRLDTFLNRMEIEAVEYLKIDTQGFDFRVIQSAGSRLKDIQSVILEVDITPVRCYAGSAAKDEIVSYMLGHGFKLVSATAQTDGKEENLAFIRVC
jgi:FkbM family methyltransferase